MAQAVGVVGVLVAGGDHKHPKAQVVSHAVDDTLGCARVGDAGGDAVGIAKTGFDLAQRHDAAEGGNDGLAADR